MASLLKVTLFGSRNSKPAAFTPSKDIPDLSSRVILITGGAGDLGRQCAIDLAFHSPAHIVLADLPRSPENTTAAVEAVTSALPDDTKAKVKVTFLDLDLASLDAVQDFVRRFKELEGRLDLLVLNAGIMPVNPGMTKDGYEVTFGVNYLGHVLLTRLLTGLMVETVEKGEEGLSGRVVVVASEGHSVAPKGGVVFGELKSSCEKMSYFKRYGQSKIALIAFTKQLAEEYPQLKVIAVHPGRISTGMGTKLAQDSRLIRWTGFIGRLVTTSVELGVRNHLWAASSNDAQSGFYYIPVGILDKNTLVEKDKTFVAKLKEWTDNELKERV